jgi:hypothetical protein
LDFVDRPMTRASIYLQRNEFTRVKIFDKEVRFSAHELDLVHLNTFRVVSISS